MMIVLTIMNAVAVGIFGTVLSVSFCDIKWTKRNKLIFCAGAVAMAVLQGSLFVLSGDTGVVRLLYPLITHLPLVLMLMMITKKKLWSLVAVLVAYQCCQLRRWTALFVVGFLGGEAWMQDMVELVVTVPLLFFVLRAASAAVRSMAHYPIGMQLQFGIVPAIGYLFDYLTRVYTNWLIEGVPAAVEFMPFVCAVAYLAFIISTMQTQERQKELEQRQMVLDLQVRQSEKEIAAMKKSQAQAAEYRHDLRHHLQYLSSCIDNSALNQAQDYIRSLNAEIINQAVIRYCENTAANLILSAFASKVEKEGISMAVSMQLGENRRISDNDFSVVLSNALENALHACKNVKALGKEASIKIRGYEKDDRIFLEVQNSCAGVILFENGIPVTKEKGHGIGVRSICAVVEKYGGVYNFERKADLFLLRISL